MKLNFIDEGKLYVFEGPDGVGKTALIKNISKGLSNINVPNKVFSFPGKENKSLGNLVYKIHHKKTSIPFESIQTLHVAAHIESIIRIIKPNIQCGTTILLDRFWLSTYVYGLFQGIEHNFLKTLVDLEKHVWKNLTPEVIFLITSDKPKKKLEIKNDNWEIIKSLYTKTIKEFNFKKVIEINNENLKKSTDSILEEIKAQKKNHYKGIHIYSSLSPVKTTIVFDTYWNFAAERQKIFFKRLKNEPYPWTDDPILRKFKFTNAYRASDRVSQFLIKEVIYKGDQSPKEVLFRIMLFKIFNKIETWNHLRLKLGELTFKEYRFERYNELLNQLNNTKPIYSSAYIMPSGTTTFGFSKKHSNHLKLIELMMTQNLPQKILELKKMEDLFNLLLTYPTIGKFLAYQYAIDINYSNLTSFKEMEFVFPGPGAFDGIKKCFADLGGLHEIDIIKLMADIQEQEFKKRGIEFKTLWMRPLQLIDCQNLFCEVDKYSRVAHPDVSGYSGRKKIKQIFTANLKPINYWYPPKWNINELIRDSNAKF